MLADWRASSRQSLAQSVELAITAEQRRADMLMEKQQTPVSKQRQGPTRQYKDNVFDQARKSSSSDIQALHREAMSKMQAKANKHV